MRMRKPDFRSIGHLRRLRRSVAAATAGLKVGNGFETGVEIGPLINDAAVGKAEAHVADAVELGATVLTGGRRHDLGGTFYSPTVLGGVTPGMRITREETFGPIAPVIRFDREEDAIALANDTETGLAAYVFARDVGRIWRVSEALEFGVVAVNTGNFSYEGAPFGGMKESGFGREGSHHALDEFLRNEVPVSRRDRELSLARRSDSLVKPRQRSATPGKPDPVSIALLRREGRPGSARSQTNPRRGGERATTARGRLRAKQPACQPRARRAPTARRVLRCSVRGRLGCSRHCPLALSERVHR